MKTTLCLKRFTNQFTLLVLLCAAAFQARARTLTWTGDFFTDPTSWSKSGNWNPSFVPADGDALIFPGSAITTTSFNDLVNLRVFSITFNGSSGSTLNGNPIFLDSAITASHTSGRARVNFDITFTTGSVTFYTISDGYLDIEQNIFLGTNDLYLYPFNASPSGTNIEVHGIISGSGGLTKLGNGDVHLLGVWPNDYTGATVVQAGNLHLKKSGVTAISSQLVIGFNPMTYPSVIDYFAEQYPPVIAVTISNGVWKMNYSAAVTNLDLSQGFIQGSGILSLMSDVFVHHGGDSYVSDSSIQCSVYLGNQTRTFWVDPDFGYGSVDFGLDGPVIGPGLGNNSPGIVKAGIGRLFLTTANTFFGPTIVDDGVLWVSNDGALGSANGNGDGTTVNGAEIVMQGATLNESLVMKGGYVEFLGTATLNGTLVLSNYTFFSGIDETSLLQINNTVSGPDSLTVLGGTVRLAGSAPNTFGSTFPGALVIPNGDTTNAVLELAKPSNVVAMPVPLSIEGGSTRTGVLRQLQNGGVSDVTLSRNGFWLLNGFSTAPVSLKFIGAGLVDSGGGQLQLNYSGTNQLHALAGSFTAQILGTVNCVGSMDDITVESPASLDIAAQIIGGGALRKLGAGTLKFSGSSANTYFGGTLVSEGTLELRKPNNTNAIPGNVIIGPAASNSFAATRFFQSGGMPQSSAATVNANSLFDLNGNGQILALLNLNDGGDAQTGSGLLTFAAGGIINVDTLTPDPIGLRASSSISGFVELPHFDTLNCNVTRYNDTYVSTEPELDVPANISGAGDIHKNGPGKIRLRGNNTFNDSPPTSAGNVQVLGGTLIAASPTALGGTGGVTFVDTAGTLALDGGITITGEPLSLFSTNAPGLQNLTGANTWSGDIRFYRDSTVGVNSGGSLLINGTIFGTGGLTKINPGTLTLGGLNNNTYSGDTFAHEGTLVLDKVAISGVTTVPHHITVGKAQPGNTATLVENDSTCIAGSVTVNNGGLWIVGQGVGENFPDFELQGHEPLTLNGNAQVQGPGFLYLPAGGGIEVNPGSNTTATISVGVGIGTLFAGPTSHPITVAAGAFQSSNPEFVITGNIDSFGAVGLQKEGTGTLKLTGTNSYAGTNLVNGGTLWVDGVQPQSPVHLNTGTRLKGSGTVGSVAVLGNSVTIAPGASPGILTCSNLNNVLDPSKGTLQIELNGPTPGSGYDQLNVRGTVNLTGLTLNRSLGFSSAVGNQFTIIANDGADAVTGTFTGLSQGAKLYIGSELFQVTYTGGSGNDVLLTRLTTPPPLTLTIERLATNSVGLLWATNDPPFSLQTCTNLAAASWSPALPPPVITGTNNFVTNSIINSHQFYRLFAQ